MDNLTHSLVGALLGRMGLKRLTPSRMPALILSAQPARHRQLRRAAVRRSIRSPPTAASPTASAGWSPCLSWLRQSFSLWQRLRPSKEGPIRAPRTAALPASSATLSHPLLDYVTTYGTRLLEPLSHRWFYGDAIFIIDPWIWLMMILGLEMSWRAERLGRNWTRPAHVGVRRRCSATSPQPRDLARAVARHAPAGRARRHAADDRRRRGPARRSGSAR